MTLRQASRYMCICEGAFISDWQHAKFDLAKQGMCQVCQEPDTQMHWLQCPKYAELRASRPEISSWSRILPYSFLHHLLVPGSPDAKLLGRPLVDIPRAAAIFHSEPSAGAQHLFTDGSSLSTASWAVVNASTGGIVSGGHLANNQQSRNSSGYYGICLWVQHYGCTACIRSDSLNTARAAKSFMAGQNTCSIVDNHDLQQDLFDILGQLDADQVCFNWIPSRLDPTLCETEVEEGGGT